MIAVQLMLHPKLLARLDRVPKWEFGTRAEVIRTMIVAGLDARAAKHKKRKT
jgi:metal-responsive CopG/Arc/MetJ family transcriptional regulator